MNTPAKLLPANHAWKIEEAMDLYQVEAWGKLPERERAKAMTEMIRNMPPAYQRMIEEYFKRGAGQGTQP